MRGYRDALLYHDDWLSVVRKHPFNFRYDIALSREHKNKAGGKLYIQVPFTYNIYANSS
jgi:ferredoxin--NADP+ reductase